MRDLDFYDVFENTRSKSVEQILSDSHIPDAGVTQLQIPMQKG
jgi:hypothetical protein